MVDSEEYKSHKMGTLKALLFYIDFMGSLGAKSNCDPLLGQTSLDHILWMAENCAEQITTADEDFCIVKCSRWLGYIQGCLVCHGYTTVAAERERTRPWFRGITQQC
jgi:hypothetical protein